MGERIQGQRIYLKPLTFEDALLLRGWGSHDSDLFIDYNLADMSNTELHFWYLSKKKGRKKSYFAIYTYENQFVGYLGLKDMNLFKKTAFLGIVLDPNEMNQGFGTEAIHLLMDYFFNSLKMKKMRLDVNLFNTRAIHTYEKIGFITLGEYLAEFENQDVDFEDPKYKEDFKYFQYFKGKLYTRVYVMEIDVWRYEMRRGNAI